MYVLLGTCFFFFFEHDFGEVACPGAQKSCRMHYLLPAHTFQFVCPVDTNYGLLSVNGFRCSSPYIWRNERYVGLVGPGRRIHIVGVVGSA